jgi:hypothetical protein
VTVPQERAQRPQPERLREEQHDERHHHRRREGERPAPTRHHRDGSQSICAAHGEIVAPVAARFREIVRAARAVDAV